MNILIPPRSARAGQLRAKFGAARLRAGQLAACALRNVLEFYLQASRGYDLYIRGTYALRCWLRGRAFALLKRLPRHTHRPFRRKPEDLDALVQRQYGWRNASHTRREDRRHAAP